jgi:hypothetical protein
MNDIIENLESDIMIFADDTFLMATGIDPAETAQQLSRDLEKISFWALKWKVVFIAEKTKEIKWLYPKSLQCLMKYEEKKFEDVSLFCKIMCRTKIAATQ